MRHLTDEVSMTFSLQSGKLIGGDSGFQCGYPAFGLYLVADLPVPGLTEAANPGFPEVRLSMASEPVDFDPRDYRDIWYESRYKASSGEPFLSILTSGKAGEDGFSYWLKYSDGTNVFVGQRNTRIWVTWPPSSCIEDAATYLLGPVMAFFAQIRGTTCLHGSSVVIDGATIALLGAQGAGKSTTAAAFASAGYPVVADDLILLVESEKGFLVEPSYPIVRLWPSSVQSLFGHEDALPRLIPTWDKRALNLNGGEYRFQSERLPLAALYLLDNRSAEERAPWLEPISGTSVLMRLVRNSWGHYADKPAILASQLQVLTRLSKALPIRRLTAHQDAARLPQLCQLLVDDVRALRAATQA